MNIVIGLLMAFSCTGCVFTIHHVSIRWLRHRLHNPRPNTVFISVVALFAAHLVEAGVYALGYFVSTEYLSIGAISGAMSGGLRDYYYYSIVTFTSLGLGDVFPYGELRLMTGFEVLTGLLVIGWSASFLYVEMQHDRTPA